MFGVDDVVAAAATRRGAFNVALALTAPVWKSACCVEDWNVIIWVGICWFGGLCGKKVKIWLLRFSAFWLVTTLRGWALCCCWEDFETELGLWKKDKKSGDGLLASTTSVLDACFWIMVVEHTTYDCAWESGVWGRRRFTREIVLPTLSEVIYLHGQLHCLGVEGSRSQISASTHVARRRARSSNFIACFRS